MYRVMIEKIYSTQPIVQILSLDYGWRQICNLTNLVARLPDEPFRLASEYSTRFAQRVHLGKLLIYKKTLNYLSRSEIYKYIFLNVFRSN